MEIPVCARCRHPLGPGMKVMVMHPDHWREFLRRRDLPIPDDIDENPVAVCLPCGIVVRSVVPTNRVQ